MRALRNHLLCAFAAALVAACGGTDPNQPDPTGGTASAASVRDSGGAKATVVRNVQSGAVLAGAATTQEAIDSAIAAQAAAAAVEDSR
jgi:hypothetical protein